jgi:hypothetical protein
VLEVQNPTQALKSVESPCYTFDLNPEWGRTVPSLGIFSWDIYRVFPQKKKKIQISK